MIYIVDFQALISKSCKVNKENTRKQVAQAAVLEKSAKVFKKMLNDVSIKKNKYLRNRGNTKE